MKAKLLIIEDETDLLDIMTEEFDTDIFDVTAVDNGFKALDALCTTRFDAVILDIYMPKLDGIQLASYIRANELNASTNIFVCSGHVEGNIQAKLTPFHVSDFVQKPFPAGKLPEIVSAKLRISRKGKAYDPKLVKILQDESLKLFRSHFGNEVVGHEPFVKGAPNSLSHYNAGQALFGRVVYGSIAISLPARPTREVVNRIFNRVFDDNLCEDYAREIANQLSGRLKTTLMKNEILINIGLPFSAIGRTKKLPRLVSAPTICLPYTIDQESMFSELTLGTIEHAKTFNENLKFSVYH